MAMLLLEALKLMISLTVTKGRKAHVQDAHKMMFIDISKAHLHADVVNNELYVELPAEMNLPNSCGHLKKALYGTRDAAKCWENRRLRGWWAHDALAKVRQSWGTEIADDKSVVMLGRIIEWKEHGVDVEADQRHVELILKEMGMEECTGSDAAGRMRLDDDEEGKLLPQDAWRREVTSP